MNELYYEASTQIMFTYCLFGYVDLGKNQFAAVIKTDVMIERLDISSESIITILTM
jgi:hypothetical protein